MRSNDLDAFKVYLAGVYSLYRTELSAVILDLWWRALKPYNLTDVREALDEHTADGEAGQFCPKPADVIKIMLAKTKPKDQLCWHCQADLTVTGRTRLRFGDVCNPCYKAYLNNEWKERDHVEEKRTVCAPAQVGEELDR